MSAKREIILCERCKGEGRTYHEEIINYHKCEYETITEVCTICEGSGRRVMTTIITIEPFQPSKDKQ